jgi:molybdenum cofactor cytidylyltransferase
LLPFRGKTLLRHAAETALAAQLGPVIVVLGFEDAACREALHGLPLTIVENSRWREGMGGSIAAGLQAIDESTHRAVIVMLCDQSAVTSEVLHTLDAEQRTTGKSIVASGYGGTVGPPALFTSDRFPELRALSGHHGAKSLFQDAAELSVVDCPEAALDIDLPADLARLADQAGAEAHG